jgi:hypothetical protein
MCDPLSITALAVGAASAGANASAQAKAANEQNRYRRSLGIAQNAQYDQNAAAVIKDVGLQIDQLAQRDIQQASATRQELESVSRNAREAGATARAQTAAAGIEGRTVDFLHAQFSRDVAEFESVAARNLRNFRAQSQMEAQAIYARGQNAINQGYPNPLPPVATVSPLTSVMQGISTGIGVYGALGSFRTPPGVAETANATTTGTTNFSQAPTAAQMYSPYQSTPILFGGDAPAILYQSGGRFA